PSSEALGSQDCLSSGEGTPCRYCRQRQDRDQMNPLQGCDQPRCAKVKAPAMNGSDAAIPRVYQTSKNTGLRFASIVSDQISNISYTIEGQPSIATDHANFMAYPKPRMTNALTQL